MAFELQPAGESDVDDLISIQIAAFANDPFYILLYNGRPNDPVVRQAVIDQTRSQWQNEPTLRAIKCVDTATGQIVGFASVKTVFASNATSQTPPNDRDENEKGSRAESFKNKKLVVPFAKMSALIWADHNTYISFGVLAIHPSYQRRGLGTKLVQWGLQICNQANLPGYITASPAGADLYARLGFRRVGNVVNLKHDFEGLADDLVSVSMVYGVDQTTLDGMKDRVSRAESPELRVV